MCVYVSDELHANCTLKSTWHTWTSRFHIILPLNLCRVLCHVNYGCYSGTSEFNFCLYSTRIILVIVISVVNEDEWSDKSKSGYGLESNLKLTCFPFVHYGIKVFFAYSTCELNLCINLHVIVAWLLQIILDFVMQSHASYLTKKNAYLRRLLNSSWKCTQTQQRNIVSTIIMIVQALECLT